jgi:hypothetical protein
MRIVSTGTAWDCVTPDRWTPEAWHAIDWEHFDAYLALVREMAAKVLPPHATFLYQREPNLRIHPPGGTAVKEWHTDAKYGHLDLEWNVWVPLTETTDDSQRLWLQTPSKGRAAVKVRRGQAFIFRGAQVPHGNVVNTTDTTRVSFDFRLLLRSHYRDTHAVSVKYGVPLRVPEYWAVMQ